MPISTTTLDIKRDWFPKEPQSQDWLNSLSGIYALAGRVCVEMLPRQGYHGVLALPDHLAGNMRPDIGWVIAAGRGVELLPGDCVIVRPSDGTYRDGVTWGDYSAEQVRTYGTFCEKAGKPYVYDWSDSIIARYDFTNMSLRATEDNIIIERTIPVKQSSGGIILPDQSQYRQGEAKVIDVGPRCYDVKVGDYIIYNPDAVNPLDLESFQENYASIREKGIDLIIKKKQVIGEFASEKVG